METPELLSLAETAAATGFSTRTIEAKVASGELGSVKVGARRLVPRSAFEAWRMSLEQRVAS